jgi:peptidoglycan/LPS O-acetylase OafA/YrhL
MAEILFVEKFPLKAFYIRRFARIYPAMAAFSVLVFLMVMKSPLHFNPAFIGADLTFTYNYVAALGHHRAEVVDHIWSLCVEEHAYVLLGLIAFLTRLRRWSAKLIIAALAAASMLDGVVSTLAGQNWFDAYWRSDTHVASILVAAVIYLATRRLATAARPHPVCVAASPLCAALGIAFFAQAFRYPISYTAGTTLLAVAVCMLDTSPRWLRTALSNPVLTWAGVLSYSIYLWQQPFYAARALDLHTPGRTLLLLAVAIGAGAGSFYLLEQPARRFLNRVLIGNRRRKVQLAASPAE